MPVSSRQIARVVGIAALGLVLPMLAVGSASAGLLDFLFGSPRSYQQPAEPRANSYAPEQQAPGTSLTVTPGGGGIYATYCVRLCDGRYFPVQRSTTAKPGQLCNSLCPASTTKIFSGADINNAIATDGSRYASLENAFAYREKIVPDCTCNGRDAFGTARVDVEDDPTLRPGDLIATEKGLKKFTGSPRMSRRGAFTPVDDSAALPVGMRGKIAASEQPQPMRPVQNLQDRFITR